MTLPSTTLTGYEATPNSEVPAKHPVATSNFIPMHGTCHDPAVEFSHA